MRKGVLTSKPKTFCTRSPYLYRADRYYTSSLVERPESKLWVGRYEHPDITTRLNTQRHIMEKRAQRILTDEELEQTLAYIRYGLPVSSKLPNVPLYYTYDGMTRGKPRSSSSTGRLQVDLKKRYHIESPGPVHYDVSRSSSSRSASIINSRTTPQEEVDIYHDTLSVEAHRKTNKFFKRFREQEMRQRKIQKIGRSVGYDIDDIFEICRREL